MKRLLSVLIILIVLHACKTTKSSSEYTINIFKAPPGTIQISNNTFFDVSEVRNLDYLEFMHWMRKVYGDNSVAYKNTLPDSTVWSKLNKNYGVLDTFYLIHPAYRNYPIVGLSYEQALIFSQWRSDRVMEFVLIKNEIFPHNPLPTKDNYFTIEKYYKGEYEGIKPNPNFLIYPHYTLPDSNTFYKMVPFADSLNNKNYKNCRKKYCSGKRLIDFNCIESRINKTIKEPYGSEPTSATYCYHCKKDIILQLKGNVRERTNIKGLNYGGSFIDSCKYSFNKLTVDTTTANCYTGFRNMCVYKKWNK